MNSTPDAMVFLVDDDPSIRKALGRLLRSAHYTHESFPSAAAFLARPAFAGPSCVVLDLRMPGFNGLELQEALTAAGRHEPIVFITGHGDVPTCANAMKAGAIDFLPKPFGDEALLAAVATSLERSRRQFQVGAERAKIQALLDRLTPREWEVLQGVIAGKLNKQIAAELGASEKTVKVHRGRVMQKMGIVSVAELVRLTETVGIRPQRGDGTKVS